MESIIKDFKREIGIRLIGGIIAIVIISVTFYFNTRNSLQAHEVELHELKQIVERKADEIPTQRELEKINKKLDYLIDLQIKDNQ